MRNIDLSLYLVTDRDMLRGYALPELVKTAVENGVTTVQLREKDASTREFIQLAVDLKKVLDPLNIPLIINDRVDVALATDASGVHLGQNDMPVSIARNLLGPDKIIGLSVETREDLETVDALNPDYLGVSPIFSTPTKTDTINEWELDGLRLVSEKTDFPLVAIGGINAENAQNVMDHGADGLAVVSAICASEDPGQAAALLRKEIDLVMGHQYQS
ncbi:thiamine phosphate synthase [Rhodohalobacter sp. 8-1]|uniref:thiamine phosphate synthase n=1 Tax=Rhodohalobacter sp. 8-1 TaxID=3131972 RepID=UPI0030EE3762